jgi:TRAP-type C4-dicarboxylate transport system permease small subunit
VSERDDGLLERLGQGAFASSRAWAVLGGIVLLGVMLMTVASVLMRAIFGLPITGDFELVEMGTAMSAFAFLPYCHQVGGNVVVDVFTARAPERIKSGLAALSSLVLLAIALVLVWRMAEGGRDFYRYHEVTTNLGIPRWWAFPPILISLALLALVSLVTGARELAATLGARSSGST